MKGISEQSSGLGRGAFGSDRLALRQAQEPASHTAHPTFLLFRNPKSAFLTRKVGL
ncbi:MAG: hypothetical protein ABIH23_06285 [bacterium]